MRDPQVLASASAKRTPISHAQHCIHARDRCEQTYLAAGHSLEELGSGVACVIDHGREGAVGLRQQLLGRAKLSNQATVKDQYLHTRKQVLVTVSHAQGFGFWGLKVLGFASLWAWCAICHIAFPLALS